MHAVLAKQLTQEQKREAHNRKPSVRVRRAVRTAFDRSVGAAMDALEERGWSGVRDAVGRVAGWVEIGVDLGTEAMDAALERLGFEEDDGDYDA